MATKQTTVGYKLRVPPNDLEAEQALLGSVMLNPKGLAEVLDFLTPEDFFAGRNQKIFAAMAKLFEKGEPVDLISVSAWLKENKQLESAGGSAYVAELSARVPSASNLRYYADLVHRKSALRSLIEASEKISDLGYQEDREVEEVLDEAQKVIFNLGAFTNKKVINLKDALGEAWERFDRLSKSDGAMRGVPTGFHDLDNKLAGLQKSDLIILAARPSVGKTSLALDIARHAACREETPTCIFSLEMSS
nr:DnaB-like helicase N-terminal domain-containing protein [Candidatus Paceibacterota bacterium]